MIIGCSFFNKWVVYLIKISISAFLTIQYGRQLFRVMWRSTNLSEIDIIYFSYVNMYTVLRVL